MKPWPMWTCYLFYGTCAVMAITVVVVHWPDHSHDRGILAGCAVVETDYTHGDPIITLECPAGRRVRMSASRVRAAGVQ